MISLATVGEQRPRNIRDMMPLERPPQTSDFMARLEELKPQLRNILEERRTKEPIMALPMLLWSGVMLVGREVMATRREELDKIQDSMSSQKLRELRAAQDFWFIVYADQAFGRSVFNTFEEQSAIYDSTEAKVSFANSQFDIGVVPTDYDSILAAAAVKWGEPKFKPVNTDSLKSYMQTRINNVLRDDSPIMEDLELLRNYRLLFPEEKLPLNPSFDHHLLEHAEELLPHAPLVVVYMLALRVFLEAEEIHRNEQTGMLEFTFSTPTEEVASSTHQPLPPRKELP